MANQEDEEMDIAAQMGFSSFGNKKRKRDDVLMVSQQAVVAASQAKPQQQAQQPLQAMAQQSNNEPDLRALRNGVRNERGDVAYFMPSFIEDPWKHLKKS